MALNINGTTGISGVDGSASAASIAGTDANTGLSFASDTVNINTGGSTRATVDSNGRLGIGTTSPVTQFHSEGSGDQYIRVSSSTHSNFLQMGLASGDTFHEYKTQYRLVDTDNGERMRILDDGGVLINQTSKNIADTKFEVTATNSNLAHFDISGNNYALIIKHGYASSGQNGVDILFKNSSGTAVGQIDHGQSTTQYRTSSDYRLKENATAISDGITRLKTLKPYRFNFIAEPDRTVDGFFAHEVTAVPEAISGTKDEVDSDNKPVYQGIDQSKLVPLLTAALQEAVAKIEVLETKVAALEAG